MTLDVAALCIAHLEEEERLLAGVLPILRAMEDAISQKRAEPLIDLMQRHQEALRLLDGISQRRRMWREEIAQHWQVAVSEVRLSRIVASLSQPNDAQVRLTRVQSLATEVVAINHRLSIYLHIHLDAFQHLLRGLTGTPSSSGRYGRHGQAEACDYRPLIQIDG